MGLLVDGVWRDDSYDTSRMQSGRFNRPTAKFRNWITPDGSPANQILVGLPMVGLYIVGIAVVWIFGKSKKSDPEVG